MTVPDAVGLPAPPVTLTVIAVVCSVVMAVGEAATATVAGAVVTVSDPVPVLVLKELLPAESGV